MSIADEPASTREHVMFGVLLTEAVRLRLNPGSLRLVATRIRQLADHPELSELYGLLLSGPQK